MDKLCNETDRLCQLYPEKTGDIAGKMEEAKNRWEALKLNAEQRKRGLDRSYNRHRFMADYRELCEWIKGIRVKMEFTKTLKSKQKLAGTYPISRVGQRCGRR